MKCLNCNVEYNINFFERHQKTKKHQMNVIIDDIEKIEKTLKEIKGFIKYTFKAERVIK